MFIPPLISIVSPVRNELSDEARNATTVATSSGRAGAAEQHALRGVLERGRRGEAAVERGLADQAGRHAVDADAVRRQLLGQRLGQRHDRRPWRPHRRRRPGPPPFQAASDDMLTMAPRLRATMPGPTARHIRNALVRLTSITGVEELVAHLEERLALDQVAGVVDEDVDRRRTAPSTAATSAATSAACVRSPWNAAPRCRLPRAPPRPLRRRRGS